MESVEVLYEPRRGCGFRQQGGLYLIGGGFRWESCCLIPSEVHSCASCGAGIKPARGWTWVKPEAILEAPAGCEIDNSVQALHQNWAVCPGRFLAAGNEPGVGTKLEGRVGLLWIGEAFYPTPSAFVLEARRQGVSRRLTQIPRDFTANRDWVLLGHRKSVGRPPDLHPGIFMIWRPKEIQYVLKPTDTQEDVERLRKRGIVPVYVEQYHGEDPYHRTYRMPPA